MKQVLKSIGVLLSACISFTSHGQNWLTNGNVGLNSTNYVGTQDAVPLQLRTTLAQPIIFQTNGATERMRLTPTGELGLGTAAPSSLLHLTSTTSGNIFRTDGPAGSLNLWQLFTGGTEKFRVSVANSSSNVNINVFQTAHMLFSTSNTERMRLTSIGRLGLGIGAPVSLLHLHREDSVVIHSRYTNLNTGSTASDGSRLGLEVDGDFRLVQFENLNTDIWTPNLALTNEIQRFRIRSNG
jgi:hypothetical protein